MFFDEKTIDRILDKIEARVRKVLAEHGIETRIEAPLVPDAPPRCPSTRGGVQCGILLDANGMHKPMSKRYMHGLKMAEIGWN